MSYRLPKTFWQGFISEYWDKKPTVFKNLFQTPIATADEQFATMCGATERWVRRGHQTSAGSANFRFWIGNRNVSSDATVHLPTKADGSIDGYADRLKRKLGPDSEFCLLVDRIPAYSYPLYTRVRQFYSGLVDEVGLPVQSVDSDQFLGNYRNTPFGVHKDNADSFVFITRKKRMLLWPYEDLAHLCPGDQRIHGFTLDMAQVPPEMRERAIVLDGEPGDVFYWPASHWHVGEGTGELSLTFNFAIYRYGTPSYHVIPELEQLVSEKVKRGQLTFPFNPDNLSETASGLPDLLEQALRVVQQVSAEQLERQIRLKWLKLTTSLGFKEVIGPEGTRELNPLQSVRRNPDAGFAFLPLAGGELAWSADGHLKILPDSEGLRAALQRVQRGERQQLGALLEAAQPESRGATVVWSKERYVQLLEELVAYRVLELID